MEFKQLQFHDLSEQDWNNFFLFRNQYRQQLIPGDPPIDEKTCKEQIKSHFPGRDSVVFVLASQDHFFADAILINENNESPSFNNNKHLASLVFKILDPIYLDDSFKNFVNKVIQEAKKNKIIKKLNIVSFESVLDNYIQSIGGCIGTKFSSNRLQITDLDRNKMKKWIEKGEERNGDLSIEFCSPVPEELYPNYCDALTQALRDMPQDNCEREYKITPKVFGETIHKLQESGKMIPTYFVQNKAGKVIALTDIIYAPSRPQACYQEMTYVSNPYRGRGIGRWLKGKMILHLIENYPEIEFFDTSNTNSNEHMLAINLEMGYKECLSGKIFNLSI